RARALARASRARRRAARPGDRRDRARADRRSRRGDARRIRRVPPQAGRALGGVRGRREAREASRLVDGSLATLDREPSLRSERARVQATASARREYAKNPEKSLRERDGPSFADARLMRSRRLRMHLVLAATLSV